MGATSLLNVTGRAVETGSAAWPSADIATKASSVAKLDCTKRNQGKRGAVMKTSCPSRMRVRTSASEVSESLAQVYRWCTRIPVGLLDRRDVHRERHGHHL